MLTQTNEMAARCAWDTRTADTPALLEVRTMTDSLSSLHRSTPSTTPAQHVAVPARVYAERSGMADMFRRNADARRLAELTAAAGLTAHTVAVVSTAAPVFAAAAEIRAQS